MSCSRRAEIIKAVAWAPLFLPVFILVVVALAIDGFARFTLGERHQR
jgi:hypothetical protein